MEIDGRIFLCGRVDGNPARHFDGSLSKLSIYDEALSAEEVCKYGSESMGDGSCCVFLFLSNNVAMCTNIRMHDHKNQKGWVM